MTKKITFQISRSIIYTFFMLITFNCFSQAGAAINATGAASDNSAMLDVSAANQGMLVPRVALTSTTSAYPVTSPANSLLVYDTATVSGVNGVSPGFYYWNTPTLQWVRLIADVSGSSGWLTNGNAGTDSTSNFIGTNDSKPLVIKTNNTEKMRIMANGNVGIGTTNPATKLHIVNSIASPTGWYKSLMVYSPSMAVDQHVQLALGASNTSMNQAEINFNYSGSGSTDNSLSFGLYDKPGIMTLTGSGNVGIGITNPTFKLDIQGAGLGTTAGNTDLLQKFCSSTGNAQYLRIFAQRSADGTAWETSDLYIQRRIDFSDMGFIKWSGGDWGIELGSGTTTTLKITNSGLVGIGTTNPTARLHVAGTAGVDGIRFPDGTLQTTAAVTPIVLVYTSNGTWTKPVGAKKVQIQIWGGGGGGGGSVASNGRAGGGGGGAYNEAFVDADLLGAAETISIGDGGNGGSLSAGGNGGVTSFGTKLYAYGGAGGSITSGAGNIGAGGGGGGINSVGSGKAGGSPLGGAGGIEGGAAAVESIFGGGGGGCSDYSGIGATSVFGGSGGGAGANGCGGGGNANRGGAGGGGGGASDFGTGGISNFGGNGGNGGTQSGTTIAQAGSVPGGGGGGRGANGTAGVGGLGGKGKCIVTTYF